MNENEKKLYMFAYRLIKSLTEITENDLCSDLYFYFGKYEVSLYDLYDLSEEEALDFINDVEEMEETIQERREDEDIAAYLVCEGDFYEGLYYYSAFGTKQWGDDTEKIFNTFKSITFEHNLWYEWCSGAISFYQSD